MRSLKALVTGFLNKVFERVLVGILIRSLYAVCGVSI